jgi:hypothetical protein
MSIYNDQLLIILKVNKEKIERDSQTRNSLKNKKTIWRDY